MGTGKPRGINCGRKLRTVRKMNRWAQKGWKKRHLGTQFKCNPFGGSSHCKGIVLEKMYAAAPYTMHCDEGWVVLWGRGEEGRFLGRL
jgi:hypothetical protein